MQERLQKLIAQAGIASRRQAEELIKSGLVTINGETAELGAKADPETDHIKVNGKLINTKIEHRKNVYLLVNKPKGFLSSVSDPEGRKLVTDLVKGYGKLHPVGRLDFQSEGLIILTNDGEFTQKVANSKKVAKVYEVKVKGLPNENAVNKLRRGVLLEDGFKTSPCEIKTLAPTNNNAWYEVTLHEGHNQQIRKMFDSVGHSVVKLRRIAIGNIREEKMPIAAHRELTAREIKELITPFSKPKVTPTVEKSDKPKLEKHSRTLKPKRPRKKKKVGLSSKDIARAKATRRKFD
ncbi:MAG: rRNA pseudouridine synthase [Pyrinomonadaceae bacterium]|nr:rRNA pseudouridine synthase [Pyrinomonadaceae bacterium]